MKPEDFLDPKNFDKITPDMYDALNQYIDEASSLQCSGSCNSCSSDCGDSGAPRFAKRLLCVTSGKGGTGKSTVTALLARNLAARGLKVAVLDADIACPVIPQLLGADGLVMEEDNKYIPVTAGENIKLLSFALFSDGPVLYPGLDMYSIAMSFYKDTLWGDDNDVFLIDMPSGAGDVHLNLLTVIPLDGTILVGEPSELAVGPLRRCTGLLHEIMAAPVAYVENKSLTGEVTLASRLDLGHRCVSMALPLSPEVATAPGGYLPAETVSLADELTDRVAALL